MPDSGPIYQIKNNYQIYKRAFVFCGIIILQQFLNINFGHFVSSFSSPAKSY